MALTSTSTDTDEDRLAEYAASKERLLASYAAIPPGARVRLAKRTSNLFRPRDPSDTPGLDVSGFDHVLSVDPASRTAVVGGTTTYEHLVEATLPHGLMPLVVPQLKTITLGGAVTGLGIESTSFRNGCPHESVLSLDVLTGDGRIVTATADNEHAELFRAFPNSYGTLGYALSLTIELEPVAPFVRLTHRRFRDLDALFAAVDDAARTRVVDGLAVDFLDCTLFAPDEAYLTIGTSEATAAYTSDYTGQQIYYLSIPQRREDFLTIQDYLWRWDTDWFWCSRAFGAQNPRLRRAWPKRWLRSDVYWKLVRWDERWAASERLDRFRGKPAREKVVQDIEVPVARAAEFARWFDTHIGMRPIWACPLKQRNPAARWPLYAFDPDTLYVNFGFWGTVPLSAGQADGHHNRLVEDEVERLGGRKSLYSTAYYSKERFGALYGGDVYAGVKKAYDPQGRLLDLYAKCVRRQ